MPLEPYPRGKVWWAKGRVEYNGRPITDYIRESTGASDEAGAKDWIQDREEAERRRYLIGEQERPLTFMDAVALYDGPPSMAKHLRPIIAEIGHRLVRDITPIEIRDLGKKLYPQGCCDSWRRWVITPARAVINNGHDIKGSLCPPIRIESYSKDERLKQDRIRGKKSRVKKKPGSWQWLLRFREHAGRYHSALALFMFATGARVGQACRMTPDHLDLQNARVCIPAGKGQDDLWITVPMEVVVELANLRPKCPRGWPRTKASKRIFGFASADGCRKGWRTACTNAKIDHIPPHAAGRHGFGQEMIVRQGADAQAVADFGGWSDPQMLLTVYTHSEDAESKIHGHFRTGLVQAEKQTGLKLLKQKG
jgi:integrase